MKLRARAPAKINLCLFLGGLREDGRHRLVTVFESVSLADELTLSVLADGGDQVQIAGVEGEDLVARTLAVLRRHGWGGPPVLLEIDKRIPVAGGLGGGSADAAATLRLADELAPVPPALLGELVSALGADVPSQLAPGLSLGTGAGEVLQPLAPLRSHAFLVLPQRFGLETGEVYAEADRLGLVRRAEGLARKLEAVEAALDRAGELPAELVHNDLEAAALSLRPEIAEALDAARESGADQVLVSGSGPTVIGLFAGAGSRERAGVAAASLAGRYPGACAATAVAESFGSPQRA